MPMGGRRPEWLTFDCYGTLIQWDEGLVDVMERILARREWAGFDAPVMRRLMAAYDRHEHRLEQSTPHRSFRIVAAEALRLALAECGLAADDSDVETLTASISAMPPFPEVVETLAALKAAGFRLCIISNTDDAIIAGNVAQLGGAIDRVVTAEQARAYKPSRRIFEHAYEVLGTAASNVVHVCASPHLDLAAARELGFRCVWVDRGTGRAGLPGYAPDATVASLDRVPPLFRDAGWL
ncbi:MAG: haloacid dehalogenase type II [Alphaproteobacteria bacterium]|nr:haloacid dehalogenase type II [Alphaproteobacteria bacterium]